MENGFTIEELGREFGVLIGQKVAEILILRKENEALKGEIVRLSVQLQEIKRRVELNQD